MSVRDVLIVGAGPTGLAAAIAAKRAGLDYCVVDKGVLVNSILHFPVNMTFFTTPELLEIGGLPFVTPYEKPTRAEALRYYRRVADTFDLQIETGERVRSIAREPGGNGAAFSVDIEVDGGGSRTRRARRVVVATGYYDNPNYLGVPGEDLPQVSHYYTEAHPFYRKPVVVVGGKNSAAEAALDLHRSGVRVTLVHRRSRLGDSIKYWVKPDIENRLAEGSIAARFEAAVVEIRPTEVIIESKGVREALPAAGVFLLSGYHTDAELLKRAGVAFDEATGGPMHHPETFETNVEGLYVAGAAAAGREGANKIFIENGRLHGDQVIADIERRARS